jgi:UDP-glucuronate 4-epimerase
MKSQKMTKNKTILITGTAGFIGFHLAEKLLARGFRVIGIDNLNDYYDVRIKKERNKILKKNKLYTFYKLDLENYKILEKIVKKEKPSSIVHLAAQAGVRYSLTNPWVYGYSNYMGTMNILEVARRNNIKRVLFASSGSVYGNNTPPFSENHSTDIPISIYGATKKANEVLGHAYHNLFGTEIGVMRFFTAYGRYGRPDLALFKFTKNILLDKPIEVYNQGEMTRTFTHVNDLVNAVIALLNKEKLSYEIYNISGTEPVKLMDFIKMIEKKIGKKAKIKFKPMQAGDISEALVDIEKAQKNLGFNPTTSIADGVDDFVEWFIENADWLTKLENPK